MAEKFALFDDLWSQRILGEINGQEVKIVKIEGEFMWHHHDVEDELFFVMGGELSMHYREGGAERIEVVGPGEFIIVPRGVEHKPEGKPGTKILLLEPKGIVNTGQEVNERTVEAQWI